MSSLGSKESDADTMDEDYVLVESQILEKSDGDKERAGEDEEEKLETPTTHETKRPTRTNLHKGERRKKKKGKEKGSFPSQNKGGTEMVITDVGSGSIPQRMRKRKGVQTLKFVVTDQTPVNISGLIEMDTSCLEVLSFHLCPLSNLSPLEQVAFPSLRTLDLSYTLVLTLPVLSVPLLETLDLSYSMVSDLSPLAQMNPPFLKRLDLYRTKVTDISPICNQSVSFKLEYLNMAELRSSNYDRPDLSPLIEMDTSNLKELHIGQTKNKDLSPLLSVDISSLEILSLLSLSDVDYNQLRGLDMRNITELHVNENAPNWIKERVFDVKLHVDGDPYLYY